MKIIDADKLIEKLSANLDNPEEFPVISLGTVMRMLANEEEAQPEVVRCKDCKHKGTKNCVANPFVIAYRCEVKDDFYCALGKRRTE